MSEYSHHREEICEDGFTFINDIFSEVEIYNLIAVIDAADNNNPTFRKSADLFAIRQFLKEIPEIKSFVFTPRLIALISTLFGDEYFVVKSIYFDKPELSNWFVAWHQDLTISVDKKVDLPGFNSWTNKNNQFAVQPPIGILEDNFTIRIHLDKTDAHNGALKVIPGSHAKGIYRAENINWAEEKEEICVVDKGGVMFMRPLLMHASERTTNSERRRVIHIEFSRIELPEEIKWVERENVVDSK